MYIHVYIHISMCIHIYSYTYIHICMYMPIHTLYMYSSYGTHLLLTFGAYASSNCCCCCAHYSPQNQNYADECGVKLLVMVMAMMRIISTSNPFKGPLRPPFKEPPICRNSLI